MFKPTIKQYIALMKLGIFPEEKIKNGKRLSVLDYEGLPIFNTDIEVLGYGGAAGGGKSKMISEWLKIVCEKYPGTRRFLARNELKRLKESTLLTFFETLDEDGYVRDSTGPKGYRYYEVKSVIEFNNGSRVTLIELGFQPSDPLYGRVGSTEYTGGAIDEASEIEYSGFDVISSRIRYKLESFCHNCAGQITRDNLLRVDKVENPDFGTDPEVIYTEDMRFFEKNVYKCPHCKKETSGITGRIICCFNPDKSRIYEKFYRRFKEGTLPSNYTFIPALPGDNPYLPKSYVQRLYGLSEVNKQRLLYGNFEYDDTPGRLFDYEKILGWFEKQTVGEMIEEEKLLNPGLDIMIKRNGFLQEYGYKYRMIVDPAREGKDLAMIIIMNHLSIEEIIVYGKCNLNDLEAKCRELMYKYGINKYDVIVDEGGVGGGLKDKLGCQGFIAHNSPIQPKKVKSDNKNDKVSYHRLRDQCYHMLSMKQSEIAISLKKVTIYNSKLNVEQLKKRIIDDVDTIVQVDIDKDAPYRVISKKDLKRKLGRSPDFGDALMMSMLFYVKKPKRVFARG